MSLKDNPFNLMSPDSHREKRSISVSLNKRKHGGGMVPMNTLTLSSPNRLPNSSPLSQLSQSSHINKLQSSPLHKYQSSSKTKNIVNTKSYEERHRAQHLREQLAKFNSPSTKSPSSKSSSKSPSKSPSKTPSKSPTPTPPRLSTPILPSRHKPVYKFEKDPTTSPPRIDNEDDDIQDSFCEMISISENQLDREPVVAISVRSIKHNNREYESNDTFKLCISSNQEYMYVCQNDQIIKKLVVSRNQLSMILFAKDCLLIELRSNRGYIQAYHYSRDANLRGYFKNHKQWNVDPSMTVGAESIEENISRINDLRDDGSDRDRTLDEKTDIFLTIPPDRFGIGATYSRATRSKTRDSPGCTIFEGLTGGKTSREPINIVDSQETFKPLEKPLPFTPDLKYAFSHNKVFTITYSDFKTLYNNDWINDSVIDFFIEYEIEQAIEQNLIKTNEIYAFNSFFYTKLMTKSNSQEDTKYYGNIKRWLNKLDIMKFPSVIIPINENAHWYGCIIRGLPKLLEQAIIEKNKVVPDDESDDKMSKLKHQDLEKEDQEEVKLSPKDLEAFNFQDSLFQDETNTQEKDSETVRPPQKHTRFQADIFVFDSLGQKHGNISNPLKRCIIDYCKDKHDVVLEKAQIRVQNVRVPKQNNFNDCGIHVIYNIRKWLSNITECERIWKSTYLKHVTRSLFKAEERNTMRKQLIDILLTLHKNQPVQGNMKPDKYHSDDDIEVIEVTPDSMESKPTETLQDVSKPVKATASPALRSSKNTTSSPASKPAKAITSSPASNAITSPELPLSPQTQETHNHRTLDPKAREALFPEIFINQSLNHAFSGSFIQEHVIEKLDSLFEKRNVVLSREQLKAISEYINKVNHVLTGSHESTSRHDELFRNLESQLESMNKLDTDRPRYQNLEIEYVIKKPSDILDSDDINESVNGVSQLHITQAPLYQLINVSDETITSNTNILDSPKNKDIKVLNKSKLHEPFSPTPKSASKRRKII